MASPAIDYSALADQARNAPPSVDYSALADQARNAPQSVGSAVVNFVKALGGNEDAANKTVASVKSTIQGLSGEPARVWSELSDTGKAMLTGNLLDATYHLAGSVPLFGAAAQRAGQAAGEGNYEEAAEHAAALLLPFALGGAGNTPAALDTVENAAKATSAGVAAGAPKVLGGAALTAGGLAAGEMASKLAPGAGWLVRAGAAWPGMRMMRQGFQEGMTAARGGAESASPIVAGEDMALLDGVSQNLAGKKFANLTAEQQTAVRDMVKRSNGAAAESAPDHPAPSQPWLTRTPEEVAANLAADQAKFGRTQASTPAGAQAPGVPVIPRGPVTDRLRVIGEIPETKAPDLDLTPPAAPVTGVRAAPGTPAGPIRPIVVSRETANAPPSGAPTVEVQPPTGAPTPEEMAAVFKGDDAATAAFNARKDLAGEVAHMGNRINIINEMADKIGDGSMTTQDLSHFNDLDLATRKAIASRVLKGGKMNIGEFLQGK